MPTAYNENGVYTFYSTTCNVDASFCEDLVHMSNDKYLHVATSETMISIYTIVRSNLGCVCTHHTANRGNILKIVVKQSSFPFLLVYQDGVCLVYSDGGEVIEKYFLIKGVGEMEIWDINNEFVVYQDAGLIFIYNGLNPPSRTSEYVLRYRESTLVTANENKVISHKAFYGKIYYIKSITGQLFRYPTRYENLINKIESIEIGDKSIVIELVDGNKYLLSAIPTCDKKFYEFSGSLYNLRSVKSARKI